MSGISLNLRVLIAASAVLSSFFGLAGMTLDRIYHANVEHALEERLLGHVYVLIAAAGLDANGILKMPVELTDKRFSDPDSGLYANVVRNDLGWHWSSVSMRDITIPFDANLARLERSVRRITEDSGRQLYLFSYGVEWSDVPDPTQAYTFSVAEDLEQFNAENAAFRRTLWVSLGGVALLLLAVQGTILRWGLSPLRQAADELLAIEVGKQSRLQLEYPHELQTLTGNINALLSHQQEHRERYRHTLADLAHSLKTPLAILRSAVDNRVGSIDNSTRELEIVVKEQVARMNQITSYELHRAAASGQTILSAPVNVQQLADKVISGLKKVYADKNVDVECVVPDMTMFHGDEGDLMEIMGNLVDNAFKWCKRRVKVVVKTKTGLHSGQRGFFLRVEDDGLGVAPEMVGYVMQRGRRADSSIAGYGIGLSIVRDIVQVYGGTLEIGASRWKGAAVNVWFPVHPGDTKAQARTSS